MNGKISELEKANSENKNFIEAVKELRKCTFQLEHSPNDVEIIWKLKAEAENAIKQHDKPTLKKLREYDDNYLVEPKFSATTPQLRIIQRRLDNLKKQMGESENVKDYSSLRWEWLFVSRVLLLEAKQGKSPIRKLSKVLKDKGVKTISRLSFLVDYCSSDIICKLQVTDKIFFQIKLYSEKQDIVSLIRSVQKEIEVSGQGEKESLLHKLRETLKDFFIAYNADKAQIGDEIQLIDNPSSKQKQLAVYLVENLVSQLLQDKEVVEVIKMK